MGGIPIPHWREGVADMKRKMLAETAQHYAANLTPPLIPPEAREFGDAVAKFESLMEGNDESDLDTKRRDFAEECGVGEWVLRNEIFATMRLEIALHKCEARVADAEARAAAALAAMYKAKGKAEAAAEESQRAKKERDVAEAERQKEAVLRARLEERMNGQKGTGRYEVTQEEVAEQLGVSVRTVKSWEAGASNPWGYTREKRRNKAAFGAYVAGLRRDLSTGENLMERVGKIHLGNRRGMGVKKGTK